MEKCRRMALPGRGVPERRRTPIRAPARHWRLCKAWYCIVIKTISKVGNLPGIIFDSAFMELAHLKVGDEMNVEVHTGGTITLTPLRPRPSREKASKIIQSTMKGYAQTMKKLA